jgi:hypothetical protein
MRGLNFDIEKYPLKMGSKIKRKKDQNKELWFQTN